LTYPIWSLWVVDHRFTTIAEWVGWFISELVMNYLVGAVCAVTLVPVVRGCADLHRAWAWALLVGRSRRALEERVADLTVRRRAAAGGRGAVAAPSRA